MDRINIGHYHTDVLDLPGTMSAEEIMLIEMTGYCTDGQRARDKFAQFIRPVVRHGDGPFNHMAEINAAIEESLADET